MTWRWAHQSETDVLTRERIARRFRHHVQTNWNPKGRIHREPCVACGNPKTDAHHVDYSRPFAVVWLCFACHRKVDHGGLKITKNMVWDYSSLVHAKPTLYRENRNGNNVCPF